MCFLTELVSASEVEIKKAVADGVYLDYVVKDGQFYVTFMSTVREDMDKVAYRTSLNCKIKHPSLWSSFCPYESVYIRIGLSSHCSC